MNSMAMSNSSWDVAIAMGVTTVNEDGYMTLSNYAMASVISQKCGLWDGMCFMVIEGLSEHIILTKAGAEKVKEKLLKEQARHIERNKKDRLIMNMLAIKQVDNIIETFNLMES
ncbi:MAG TPA: hypothetical protein VK190_02855 [Pseudoneobacillus sp.]|nr:hypothetical protein [Pseudoneobacillus sp.]